MPKSQTWYYMKLHIDASQIGSYSHTYIRVAY
ncbi:hypothetical protein F383_07822 [Gossypium arboreum]|uniref:Uncharacterized protein n=1 Tax=Gossypium arboreum TaxID=29729 RepID=A0A0B0PWY0_GOSAR|nr:hypothetical protein F383_07822 [Gossypium arboreum]